MVFIAGLFVGIGFGVAMRNAAVLLIRLALLTPAVLGAQSSTFEAASIRRNVSTNMQDRASPDRNRWPIHCGWRDIEATR